MSESQKKILEMLANKKISVDEAYRLLSVLEPEGSASEYLRVTVVPGPSHEHGHRGDLVNVRVPMSLIRSGMKFTSLLPSEARDKVTGALRDKGIDFDTRNLKPEELDEFIDALSELEVKVLGSDGEIVKVFVE
jgi:hypothetical protein